VENQNQVFHFPTAALPLSENRKHKNRWGASPPLAKALRAWLPAQIHGAVATAARALWALASTEQDQRKETSRSSPHFRLIPYWNRTAASGSSRIGINS
jgi:hypothetical protein